MKFSYQCTDGHRFESDGDPGLAAPMVACACGLTAGRDFAADFGSQVISTGDPFRAYHLSTAKSRAAVEQQREIGGPSDNFERKREEAVRGIQYVGNETGGMTAAARRGIERARRSK